MRSLIIILLILKAMNAAAQDSYVVFQMGVGTYRMTSQKLFRDEFSAVSGLPLRTTDDFPPYYTFGSTVAQRLSRKLSAGGWYNYMSTGGRLNYKDYSGYALLDQNLRANQYGLFVQGKVNTSEQWSFLLTFHTSLIHSILSVNDALVVGSSAQTYSAKLTSNSFSFRPGIMIQKKLRAWVLQTNLGYELQSSQDLKTSDDKYLYSPRSRTTAKADWTGLRLAIGAGFLLNRRTPDNTVAALPQTQ